MNGKRRAVFLPKNPAGHRSNYVLYATALLILIAGISAARYAGRQTDLQMRRDLVNRTAAIALAIDPEDIRSLSFSSADLNRPEFLRLRGHLRAVAEASGLRSLYTMALRNGKIVFGPESLPPDDRYASPPGTVYQTPTEKDFEIFRTGEPQIQGPARDEYGTFVTATFPVTDPQTGETLLVAGIDVEASAWRAAIRKAQWIPILIAAGLLSILLAGRLLIKWRTNHSPAPAGHLRHIESSLCAVFMLMLTLTVSVLLNNAEKKAREESFDTLARAQAAIFNETFIRFHNELHAVSQFFESSELVTREEFQQFERRLTTDTPALACIWIPEVPAGEAEPFTAAARKDGLNGFRIWQQDEQGNAIAAAGRPLFYPVFYIEPSGHTEKAYGYDIGSDPLCRAAIQETLRTGLETATDPGKLIALPDQPCGIFIFQPVSAGRQKGLTGLAVDIEQMIRNRFYKTGGDHAGLSVTLYQLQSGEKPRRLVCSKPNCSETCHENKKYGLYETVPLFAFGKTYSLLILPEKKWLDAHPLSSGRNAAAAGILLTVLLCGLVHMLANRHLILERLVQERTDELDRSRRKIASLFRSAPVGIGLAVDRVLMEVNDQVCTMTGYARSELLGSDALLLYTSQEEYERVDRERSEQISKTGSSTIETRWKNRDGTVTDILLTSAPIDPADLQKGITFTALDISRRKQDEQALRASEEKYRTTFSSIGDAVISADVTERIAGMNSAAEALTGWKESEAVGRPLATVFRIINETTRNPVESPAAKVLAEGKIVALTSHTVLLCRDGREIPIADSGAPVKNEKGEITGIVLVFRDQTRERSVQKVIEESELRYRQLFENMTAGFALHEMIYDRLGAPQDYRFLVVNPAFERLTGLSADRIIGRTVKEVLPGTELRWIEQYSKVVKTGVAAEFQDYSKDLNRFFDVKAFCPAPGRFAVVFTDITKQKHAEADLNERLSELERFNRAAIDREVRMVALKKEINALSTQLNRPAPYPVASAKPEPSVPPGPERNGFFKQLFKRFTSHAN